MAWNNVLCMYYSRTGNTKRTMEEIAKALNAELVEIQDGVDRGGAGGWLRCGLDAVRRSSPKVRFTTKWPLSDYRLVIVGRTVQRPGAGLFEAERQGPAQRLLCRRPGLRGQERGDLSADGSLHALRTPDSGVAEKRLRGM